MKRASADPVIYTFDPVVALHDENVTLENAREDIDMELSPSIYTAPPQLVAEHEVNVNEESVSFFKLDVNLAEITPPFGAEHFVNVALVIV